ncbi:MAG: hypothetical protein NVSMB47_14640 [Polyangiales bacterium]
MPADRQPRSAHRLARRAVFVAVALGLSSAVARDVSAEGKSSFLAEQLKKNPDFRVRISAALSLGTSDDPAAVKPLCGCLDDGSEVESVRVACAAALGKLKRPGSDACLKDHVGDSSPKVKEQVATSIKSLGGSVPTTGGGGGADQCPTPPAKGKPKYYVGVAISNKTNRSDGEIQSMVGKEVRCKLLSAGGRFKVASDDQIDPKSMAGVVGKEKLDGYFLQMQVDPIKYDGGQLKISMKLTIMSHTRDLKGEATKTLAMPGVTSPSKDDEDDLLRAAAQKLADSFADLKQ